MEEAEAAKQREAPGESQLISSLGGHISRCWTDAKEAKREVEQEMARALRQRNGTYEPEKLAAIKEMGGSEVYMLMTSTKCRAAEAWINDVYRPIIERPFSLSPTPIPDLPPDIEANIKNDVYELAQEVLEQAAAAGQMIPDPDLTAELKKYALSRKDREMQKLKEKATKRADRMAEKIADQFAEGGWINAISEVVSDFCTLQAAVLKGPVLRNRLTQYWAQDETGKFNVEVEHKVVPEYDRVSPFDIYPAPDSRDPGDGYLIERHRITRQEVQALIGVPGYSEQNIRKVLKDYPTGLYSYEAIDSERERIELGGNTTSARKGEKLEALEFWGAVPGSMLKEWGLDDDLDDDLDYDINAWKIGSHVIRAVLNPDPLGRKPYYVDSYERVAGSFWGKGIPDLMKDVQDICNAVARAIVNNSALASGPQVEVNTDRAESDEGIYPWKIWQADNQQMSDSPAVRFFQPQIIVNELLRVFEFFSTMSEDQTGIPRWSYCNADMGGAGSTSSGLSMLMGHASKGVKESISHIDKMVGDCAGRTYDYNMRFDEDDSIKGDCRVMARGSAALVAKEQQVVRIREMLQATNNPADLEIIGLEGRAKLLKAATKDLLDGEEIIPDEQKLMQIVERVRQKEMMLLQQGMGAGPKGGTPGASPMTLDNAGNPAGGVDTNLHQNQPGMATGVRG